MLGKTFKGMTDEMLAWQTERLLALETDRERPRRARPPRARGRDRVRRRADEPALSRRRGAAVRAREGLPAGQAPTRRTPSRPCASSTLARSNLVRSATRGRYRHDALRNASHLGVHRDARRRVRDDRRVHRRDRLGVRGRGLLADARRAAASGCRSRSSSPRCRSRSPRRCGRSPTSATRWPLASRWRTSSPRASTARRRRRVPERTHGDRRSRRPDRGQLVNEPGWRWSEHVRPTVGGEWCQVRHVGFVISGRLGIDFTDGIVGRVRAGRRVRHPAGPRRLHGRRRARACRSSGAGIRPGRASRRRRTAACSRRCSSPTSSSSTELATRSRRRGAGAICSRSYFEAMRGASSSASAAAR